MTRKRKKLRNRVRRKAVAQGWMYAVDAYQFGAPPGRRLSPDHRRAAQGIHAMRVTH